MCGQGLRRDGMAAHRWRAYVNPDIRLTPLGNHSWLASLYTRVSRVWEPWHAYADKAYKQSPGALPAVSWRGTENVSILIISNRKEIYTQNIKKFLYFCRYFTLFACFLCGERVLFYAHGPHIHSQRAYSVIFLDSFFLLLDIKTEIFSSFFFLLLDIFPWHSQRKSL